MFGEGKYEAQNRYDDWNTVQVKLKLNKNTDRDILRWMNGHKCSPSSSVQGAIKSLIRADIAAAAGSGTVVEGTVE